MKGDGGLFALMSKGIPQAINIKFKACGDKRIDLNDLMSLFLKTSFT